MIICGKNVVREALKANYKIKEIFLEEKFDRNCEIYNEIKKRKIKLSFLDKKKLDSMIESNQGIVADVCEFNYLDLKKCIDKNKNQVFLLLDEVVDPHNLGAVLRTCDATNVDLVVIPKDRSVKVNETVIKISTGSAFQVKIALVSNINSAIDILKENGFWIYGADMSGEYDYTNLDLRTSIGIVIGNEGLGISKLTKKKCDYLIKIPMSGKINSLNASVSASLILYEAYKKRIN